MHVGAVSADYDIYSILVARLILLSNIFIFIVHRQHLFVELVLAKVGHGAPWSIHISKHWYRSARISEL
jgi:hypothetical protein